MKAQQAHRTSPGSALASVAWSALVCVLFALVPVASASAAEITYISLTGSWHDATDNLPGAQAGDPVITNVNPTSIIRWGTVTNTPQSGYDFTAANPLPP